MSKRLEKIESHIQKWIEGAGKIFTSGAPADNLTDQLIRCMRENAALDASGQLAAPSRYLVEANSEKPGEEGLNPAELDQLAASLMNAAADAGIMLHGNPEITFRLNPDIAAGSLRISPQAVINNHGHTASVNVLSDPETDPEPDISLPQGAFLILNGSETIPLQKPVINLGRRENNDIILDDPRVSRNHAQLRLIKGRYVVFDLNSSGGTLVNNVPIKQKELLPGDVISMAGVPVIFGQDSGAGLVEPGDQTPTNQLMSKLPGEKK